MKKKTSALKEIPVWPAMFTSALFLATVIGLVGGLVILSSSLKGWKAFGDSILGTFFGVFILSPIYGVVMGVLAAIYNRAARITGGFKIISEIESEE